MYKVFKGYVPTRDKKCLVRFKNRRSQDLYSLEDVEKMPEYAGILADETVLIDIDDFEESEILFRIVQDKKLKCRVYETTRGKHFLFQNSALETCKTHTRLACGLNADIKLGRRNSYSILKFKGKNRKILYDTDDYEILPKWLNPVNSRLDFLCMEEGDGRNQALFNYILTLQSNNFSVSECRECLEIINDYVLSVPLSDDELKTLSRDEAFKKPVFFNGKTFLFDKFAVYLKNNDYIKRINGRLHIYKDGIYIDTQRLIESAMIDKIPTLSKAKRNEVLSYLDVMIDKDTSISGAEYIAFKNGVYNIKTDELIPFSPEIVVTNKINHNYNPEAVCEIVDQTLKKLAVGDDEIIQLLKEAVGYTFFRRNELRKAFMLTGEKKNGKSTFLAMLKTLLGENNTSALDLKELGDRFSSASMFNKLANIGDDISDEFITNPAIFKKIVSGDRIRGELKGEKEFFFEPYCKLFFSANDIPKMKDKTGAVLDRLIIIPFNARFDVKDPDYDPYIKYKLIQEDALERLILLGLQGLKDVLKNQRFTLPEKSRRELAEYEIGNNPILQFFADVERADIVGQTTTGVYNRYCAFCMDNFCKPISNIEFSRRVKKAYDVKITRRTIGGNKFKYFE